MRLTQRVEEAERAVAAREPVPLTDEQRVTRLHHVLSLTPEAVAALDPVSATRYRRLLELLDLGERRAKAGGDR